MSAAFSSGAFDTASFSELAFSFGGAPPVVVAPTRRPKRHSGKRPLVLQVGGQVGTLANADDRDVLELVNVLAITGVFHGGRQ